MSHVDKLFLHRLTELETSIASADEFTVLSASATIRMLLIDGSTLVDQVNRAHRLKIVFEICDAGPSVPGLEDPAVWSLQDGLDPATSRPGRKSKVVNRDQFLATILTVVDGRAYTLREIVLFEANIMGGVHAGSPKEDKEKILQTVNGALSIGGDRTSLAQLRAIGRVVLKGLNPLRVAVGSAPHA